MQQVSVDQSEVVALPGRPQTLGEPGWHRIDAAGEPAATLAHGRKALNLSAKHPTI